MSACFDVGLLRVIFWRAMWFQIIACVAFAGFYGMYILIDTHLLIKRGKISIEEDDYILAAISLYVVGRGQPVSSKSSAWSRLAPTYTSGDRQKEGAQLYACLQTTSASDVVCLGKSLARSLLHRCVSLSTCVDVSVYLHACGQACV